MIDTYYRIRALHDLGIQIHLHCFEYGRNNPGVLASLCKSVNYYQRNMGISGHLSVMPHVVFSRQSEKLLQNLTTDNHPVLFDGLHTTYYLDHPSLAGRKKFVRVHNIEHRFYRNLTKSEKNLIKKSYYAVESFRLWWYEKRLTKADAIFPISLSDNQYFSSENKTVRILLPFFPFNKLECLTGCGHYIIYHGNLWLSENQVICEFLIDKVFSKITYPCIIAGKSPSAKLRAKASHHKNITLIPDPDEEQMTRLIKDAHINLIPARTCNGFRLKLLYALFAGRHCITNNMMLKGTYLNSLCHIADDSASVIEKINCLMEQPFTEEMISGRASIIGETYSNIRNAEMMVSIIFSGNQEFPSSAVNNK